MAVSLNKSNTVGSRVALGRNIEKLSRVAQSLATGDALVDATGRAIGSSLQGDAQVTEVVLTGLKQSKAMFYIAEQGLKSMYDTATQMTQVVAKAKLGFMNDTLIKTTLAPVYKQLKAELDRIAEAINFNNQSLFNGSGINVTAPVRATMDIIPNVKLSGAKIATDRFNAASAGPAAGVDILDYLSATVDTTPYAMAAFNISSNANSSLEFDTFAADFSYNAAAKETTITGVRVIYQDVNFSTGATPLGKTDIVLDGIELKVSGEIKKGDTSLTGALSVVNTEAEYRAIKPKFLNSTNTAGASVSITNGSFDPAAVLPLDLYTFTRSGTNDAITITNIDASSVKLTGGETGYTSFDFVTNRDLFASKVSFDFPTLTLDKLIATLNSDVYRGENEPMTLTDLNTEADANVDIALIDSLVNKMVIELGNVSAAQIRINNIVGQVETQTDETYKAMSEILHTDIPKAVEELAQINATVQLTMITLQRMTKYVDQLLILVQ